MIGLSTGEVMEPTETGNDILLYSNGKSGCIMLYLIITLMLGVGHEEP